MYNKDTKNPLRSYLQPDSPQTLLNSLLFDKTISHLDQSSLIIIRKEVAQLIIQIRTLQQLIHRKQITIQEYQRELEAKDGIIEMLDTAKKQIEQSIEQIVSYNQHYLQIIYQKDQQIQELVNKANTSHTEIEQVYHYDIDNDIKVNLAQKWDCINEEEHKYRHKSKANIIQPNYILNQIPKNKQTKSKSQARRSVLDQVKKYISTTQERFKKADRSMDQSIKFSDQTF